MRKLSNNIVKIKTNDTKGSLIINGKNFSEVVNGVDIKIRAGRQPEVTVHLLSRETEISIVDGMLKTYHPDASTAYIVKGSNCGRNENGEFHCECGKCEAISSEASENMAISNTYA